MPDRTAADRSSPESPIAAVASQGQGRLENMSRSIRLAHDYATLEQLRALVIYQAERIYGQSSGKDTGFPASGPVAPSAASIAPSRTDCPPEALAVVERVLGFDTIFRKPPRVAAPRLLDELASLGYQMEHKP